MLSAREIFDLQATVLPCAVAPSPARVQPGQVWLWGEHETYCVERIHTIQGDAHVDLVCEADGHSEQVVALNRRFDRPLSPLFPKVQSGQVWMVGGRVIVIMDVTVNESNFTGQATFEVLHNIEGPDAPPLPSKLMIIDGVFAVGTDTQVVYLGHYLNEAEAPVQIGDVRQFAGFAVKAEVVGTVSIPGQDEVSAMVTKNGGRSVSIIEMPSKLVYRLPSPFRTRLISSALAVIPVVTPESTPDPGPSTPEVEAEPAVVVDPDAGKTTQELYDSMKSRGAEVLLSYNLGEEHLRLRNEALLHVRYPEQREGWVPLPIKDDSPVTMHLGQVWDVDGLGLSVVVKEETVIDRARAILLNEEGETYAIYGSLPLPVRVDPEVHTRLLPMFPAVSDGQVWRMGNSVVRIVGFPYERDGQFLVDGRFLVDAKTLRTNDKAVGDELVFSLVVERGLPVFDSVVQVPVVFMGMFEQNGEPPVEDAPAPKLDEGEFAFEPEPGFAGVSVFESFDPVEEQEPDGHVSFRPGEKYRFTKQGLVDYRLDGLVTPEDVFVPVTVREMGSKDRLSMAIDFVSKDCFTASRRIEIECTRNGWRSVVSGAFIHMKEEI